MLEQIEDGKVEAVCIKDMSRLGRDYLQIGIYMETMQKMSVKLIAVNDGVDSFSGEDDFTPFCNIKMNGMHVTQVRKAGLPSKPKKTRESMLQAVRHMAI